MDDNLNNYPFQTSFLRKEKEDAAPIIKIIHISKSQAITINSIPDSLKDASKAIITKVDLGDALYLHFTNKVSREQAEQFGRAILEQPVSSNTDFINSIIQTNVSYTLLSNQNGSGTLTSADEISSLIQNLTQKPLDNDVVPVSFSLKTCS